MKFKNSKLYMKHLMIVCLCFSTSSFANTYNDLLNTSVDGVANNISFDAAQTMIVTNEWNMPLRGETIALPECNIILNQDDMVVLLKRKVLKINTDMEDILKPRCDGIKNQETFAPTDDHSLKMFADEAAKDSVLIDGDGKETVVKGVDVNFNKSPDGTIQLDASTKFSFATDCEGKDPNTVSEWRYNKCHTLSATFVRSIP